MLGTIATFVKSGRIVSWPLSVKGQFEAILIGTITPAKTNEESASGLCVMLSAISAGAQCANSGLSVGMFWQT